MKASRSLELERFLDQLQDFTVGGSGLMADKPWVKLKPHNRSAIDQLYQWWIRSPLTFEVQWQCPVSHIFFADDSLLFFEASNQNASHILAILNAYSEASGQLINFNKSSIKFSPNTPVVVKESISHLFGFEDMYPSAFYLGLPAALGRNKMIMFDFIGERALKKLKGWKSKNMSQSGGEVLIKSVIQAISSFAMQCFLLPSLINSIISSIRKNFGGGDAETRHIHWKAWDVM
ncbi:hypothetical protein POM88_052207 [Heracleum sosnowskyi]|uniref:Reverse transcriptase domain-containing protein n=1 Tax=Heracleum sosnowskyi TaxID=360622 RepID=A0AAD8GRI3_9APIA|nr:hypothetical protein POM88_052207 [Heracleum sosnowskyi]